LLPVTVDPSNTTVSELTDGLTSASTAIAHSFQKSGAPDYYDTVKTVQLAVVVVPRFTYNVVPTAVPVVLIIIAPIA
jgi:hypothetical protein